MRTNGSTLVEFVRLPDDDTETWREWHGTFAVAMEADEATEAEYSTDVEAAEAAVASVTVTVPPGKSRSVRFAVSWDVPLVE